MKPVFTIFKREFFGYFRSPVAYVFLAAFLVVTVGLTWFLGRFYDQNSADLSLFFQFLPLVFIPFIPAVGMRLWSEEKRSGTWELLFTLPVSVTQAVIAKFLAAWLFVGTALVLTINLPITVIYLGDPDMGPILGGYFGSFLMAGAFLGICSLTSSLTKNQVISFVVSLMVCLVLVLLGLSVFSDLLNDMGIPVAVVDAIANFSFVTHFEPLTKGLLAMEDVVFFLSIPVFCLMANILVLER